MSDLISRQVALDGIEQFRPIKPTRGETSMEAVNRSAWECAINCAESFVRTMPSSARPERKTGRWIIEPGIGRKCSQCEFDIGNDLDWMEYVNYCPNCGAKMEVEHD